VARFGVICQPTIGHLNPMTTLCKELLRRRHDIVFFRLLETKADIRCRLGKDCRAEYCIWISDSCGSFLFLICIPNDCRSLENTPANGKLIGRRRVQVPCPKGNRARRSDAGVRS